MPPAVVLLGSLPLEAVNTLYRYDRELCLLSYWVAAETAWWALHSVGRALVSRGWWDSRTPREDLGSEERWRLWVKMCESSVDPWEWLAGVFLVPGARRAPGGAEDPNITRVQLKNVGRTNVEECESL